MKTATFLKYVFLVFSALCLKGVVAAEITYPYHATPERERIILQGYEKIKSGMSTNEVKEILGEPDELRDLYEPKIKAGKQIGFTYWYLIQRIKSTGNQAEKNEKLVRVSFGMNGKVTNVDKW